MTFITIQNAERTRLSAHVTKNTTKLENYTCPLRRQLSALYELTRRKRNPL